MDAELSAALIMFDAADPEDLTGARARLRAVHHANDVAFPASLRVRDLPAAADGPPVPVRLYEPLEAPGPAATLMWLHGGAFANGFAELDDDLCGRLAADSGFVVVSPDYRLSPEHPFPAGFDDAYATAGWLEHRAVSGGIDDAVLAVGGSSAGGALAAGICQRARDEGGPHLALQILICPVIDDRLATPSMARFTQAPIFTSGEAELMWHRYLGAQRSSPPPYAAPGRTADLSDLPPAYVLTADEDPLRDEGIDYALRLIAAGNQVELHHLPGTFHSFDTIAPTAGISQRVYREYVSALRDCRLLRGPQKSADGAGEALWRFERNEVAFSEHNGEPRVAEPFVEPV